MTRDEFDALPLMLRVEDVMRVLDIGRTATYEAIRSGQIPAVRVGKSLRIPKHRLADMVGLNGVGREDAARGAADGDPTAMHKKA